MSETPWGRASSRLRWVGWKRSEAPVANTLDLDPDLSDADFTRELENVFGIRLTQSDVGNWLTIGDVYDTLRNYSLLYAT
jgi:hypothetical protein